MTTRRSSMYHRRKAGPLTTGIVAALVAITGIAGCSPDTDSSQEPDAITTPDPARGAADGVSDLSEGGKNLDENLNVPGSETDEEVDESPYGDDDS